MIGFKERVLRTIWKVEKDGTINYLVGTAHFFPYRFQKSLEKLIRKGKRIFFEGPLDNYGMRDVVIRGTQGEGSSAIYDALDKETIREIKRKTGGRFKESTQLPIFLFMASKEYDLLYQHFCSLRPWMAFFNLWTQYLRERGWKYSVDLQALEIATRMEKDVRYLETIEEQVAAMEKIPVDRFINFLKKVPHWDEYTKAHVQVYLSGSLQEIMSHSSDYPSRCPSIIEDRDPIMFERMMPSFAEGETIAFVGSAHVRGLKKMLEAVGYRIEQVTELEG
jgi:uncharacterized protein YbaP (TraB family)